MRSQEEERILGYINPPNPTKLYLKLKYYGHKDLKNTSFLAVPSNVPV